MKSNQKPAAAESAPSLTKPAAIQEIDIRQLEVVDLKDIGAFLDWGQEKDLFLPHSEQIWEVEVSDLVVVAIYSDKAGRPCASMKLEKFLLPAQSDHFTSNQAVKVIVYDKTDLGYKVIVENKYSGILFANEVFRKLGPGENITAYVKQIRTDGKIDLILQAQGHKGADEVTPLILELLNNNGGFYPLTDKTSPEKIYELFGVSKKKYKIALGGLYKARKIKIAEDGIYLIKP